MIRRLPLLVLAVAALTSSACGAGPGQQAGDVELLVTNDYGARELVRLGQPKRGGDDTVMRLLQRNAKVTTRYGGGFVQSVDGLAGGRERGQPVDWFYYVNGVEADEGATSRKVEDGAKIWWDRRDWGAAQRVPAVVGSFPEPFKTGEKGRRLPVRIECSEVGSSACDAVYERFTELGIVAARGGLGTSGGDTTLRVLVGPWTELRGRDRFSQLLADGPRASGVFARFEDGGRTLVTLDSRGRTRRTLGARTGLIAAGRDGLFPPTWVVTGTDAAGVDSAVLALDESALEAKYAVAVSDDRGVPLPERTRVAP
jgi:hypothetical protein